MCTAHGYLLGQPLLVRRLKESLPVFGSGRLRLRTKLEMN